MKKLNDANIGILVLLSTCLCLFSCNNDNDNLPKDYAGFEHSKETVECEGNKSECELEIKIVAMEKAKEDRTVVLAAPPPVTGQAAVIQLTEKKVIIKASRSKNRYGIVAGKAGLPGNNFCTASHGSLFEVFQNGTGDLQ